MNDDSEIKIGQVLWLNVRYQTDIISIIKHPMLVVKTEKEYIEVIAIDKTAGKMHQLFHRYNYYIDCDNPKESVIHEDSYAQLNTKLTIENIEELKFARKTIKKLSIQKLDELIYEYNNYQSKYGVDEHRIVHMNSNEILSLNPDISKISVAK